MRKIDSLTGVRLFAALAVFASHLPVPAVMPDRLFTVMSSGYNGVTLFFILSGFVLTWKYADRLADPDRVSLRNFAVARVARIAPLYLAALAFVVVALRPGWPDGGWLHVFALQTWSGSPEVAFALNSPAWSVGVETFLYATFPLVVWVLVRRSSRGVVVALVGAVVVLAAITAAVYAVDGWRTESIADPWSGHRLLYRTPLTRLPDFVAGAATALLVKRSSGPSRWAPAVQWASVLMVGALMSSRAISYSVVSWDLAYIVPFVALIWSLAMGEQTWLSRLLAHRVITYGGVISYAFYLFHVPLLDLVDVDASSGASWAIGSGLALLLTLAVAAAAHHVIEEPAQRFILRRLSARRAEVRA